jgi:hypothetical protein
MGLKIKLRKEGGGGGGGTDQGLQDVIIYNDILTQDNDIIQIGYEMNWDLGAGSSVEWGGVADNQYFDAYMVNDITGGYGEIFVNKDYAGIYSRNGTAIINRRVEVGQTEVHLQSDKFRFNLLNYTTGAGYVWTDVLGDGVMTLQPPAGGGGSGWLLTGNAGTVAGTNFLGTTDNIGLHLKVNGISEIMVGPVTTKSSRIYIGNVSSVTDYKVQIWDMWTSGYNGLTIENGANSTLARAAVSFVQGWAGYQTARISSLGGSPGYNNSELTFDLAAPDGILYGVMNLYGTGGRMKLNYYGTGAQTGTAAYNLAVDASGNVIEVATGDGAETDPLSWHLTGNTGLTNMVDNFIGTTDAVPIQFMTNGLSAATLYKNSGPGGAYFTLFGEISSNVELGAPSGNAYIALGSYGSFTTITAQGIMTSKTNSTWDIRGNTSGPDNIIFSRALASGPGNIISARYGPAGTDIFNVYHNGGNIYHMGMGLAASRHNLIMVNFESVTQATMPFPRMTEAQKDLLTGSILTGAITNAGSGYTDGVYIVGSTVGFSIIGGDYTTITGGIVVVTGGVVTSISSLAGQGYKTGDVLGVSGIPGGSGFQYTVATISGVEGMFVYDKVAQRPEFFDGQQWKGLIDETTIVTINQTIMSIAGNYSQSII